MLALTSRSCGNSGEASRPASDLSPASDASRAVARSSAVNSRLHLLEGRTTGVASLLTSIGALSSSPVKRIVRRIGQAAEQRTASKLKEIAVREKWKMPRVSCGRCVKKRAAHGM